jgi:DNA-binding CsgD family transcriptional regulator
VSDKTTRVRRFHPEAQTTDRLPCVEIVAGARRGDRIMLEPGVNRFGRETRFEICLDEDGVSRKHGEIHIDAHGLATLVDLQSTNGTFVNGSKVSRIPLREGDLVHVGGQVEFRFGYRTPAEVAAAKHNLVHRPPQNSLLTARELDVARLAAEGYSNDGVGAHLDISARTVGKHLSNIYKKLGIHTRAELTRWVLLQR